MMTSDLETCNWNNMITSLSLEWWFYIRWLPEWGDHQTNIQIKFHHIIKNASNSYSKFWYLCWTIKQHQSMEHSMCSWLAPSQTTSNHQSIKVGCESNRAKHGVTYYSSLDWLRKPVLLAVVGGLKQVNRRQLLTLTLFFLKCFSTKIKILFSKNQKCYSTRIKR